MPPPWPSPPPPPPLPPPPSPSAPLGQAEAAPLEQPQTTHRPRHRRMATRVPLIVRRRADKSEDLPPAPSTNRVVAQDREAPNDRQRAHPQRVRLARLDEAIRASPLSSGTRVETAPPLLLRLAPARPRRLLLVPLPFRSRSPRLAPGRLRRPLPSSADADIQWPAARGSPLSAPPLSPLGTAALRVRAAAAVLAVRGAGSSSSSDVPRPPSSESQPP